MPPSNVANTFLRAEFSAQERRRRPHPASRQRGRSRRAAPGWARRAASNGSIPDLPSDRFPSPRQHCLTAMTMPRKTGSHRPLKARKSCLMGRIIPKTNSCHVRVGKNAMIFHYRRNKAVCGARSRTRLRRSPAGVARRYNQDFRGGRTRSFADDDTQRSPSRRPRFLA